MNGTGDNTSHRHSAGRRIAKSSSPGPFTLRGRNSVAGGKSTAQTQAKPSDIKTCHVSMHKRLSTVVSGRGDFSDVTFPPSK